MIQIRDEIIAQLEEDMHKRRIAKEKLTRKVEAAVHRTHHGGGGESDEDDNEKANEKETIRLVPLPSKLGVIRRIKRRRRERRLRNSGIAPSDSDADGTDVKQEERDEDATLQDMGRREHIQLLHLGNFWAQFRIVLDIAGAIFFMVGVFCYLIGTVRTHVHISSSCQLSCVCPASPVSRASVWSLTSSLTQFHVHVCLCVFLVSSTAFIHCVITTYRSRSIDCSILDALGRGLAHLGNELVQCRRRSLHCRQLLLPCQLHGVLPRASLAPDKLCVVGELVEHTWLHSVPSRLRNHAQLHQLNRARCVMAADFHWIHNWIDPFCDCRVSHDI